MSMRASHRSVIALAAVAGALVVHPHFAGEAETAKQIRQSMADLPGVRLQRRRNPTLRSLQCLPRKSSTAR
jgi:hypothetical protein